MKIIREFTRVVFAFAMISWISCSVAADRIFSTTPHQIDASAGESFMQKGTSKERPRRLQSLTPLPSRWLGLLPLQSIRADVERLLGKPTQTVDSTDIYSSHAARIAVTYSMGPCKLSGVERWNVPKDVTIRIDIRPSDLRVKDLRLDPRKYDRARQSHPNNWFSYWNREDGIRVETMRNGRVEEVNSITYGPKANSQLLRCQTE